MWKKCEMKKNEHKTVQKIKRCASSSSASEKLV